MAEPMFPPMFPKPEPMQRFCKDCRHHQRRGTGIDSLGLVTDIDDFCGVRLVRLGPDPVTGVTQWESAMPCRIIRNAKLDCDRFEAKPARPWWRFW